MKLVFVIIILVVTTMCCCYSFTLITTTVAVGSSAPIGQSQINAWLLGTPQPGPYGEPVSNGEIRLAMTAPYGAYFSDDTSFLCIDPILGVDTYITDCYHTFRGAGKWAHTGIDYGTSYSDGHPLVSVMGGQVVFMGIMSNSDGSPGWGQTIVIENNGYQVVYSHLTGFVDGLREGNIVRAGDLVAYSGGGQSNLAERGSSSGSHLHLEIRRCEDHDGEGAITCRAVDPTQQIFPGASTACNWYEHVDVPEIGAVFQSEACAQQYLESYFARQGDGYNMNQAAVDGANNLSAHPVSPDEFNLPDLSQWQSVAGQE